MGLQASDKKRQEQQEEQQRKLERQRLETELRIAQAWDREHAQNESVRPAAAAMAH